MPGNTTHTYTEVANALNSAADDLDTDQDDLINTLLGLALERLKTPGISVVDAYRANWSVPDDATQDDLAYFDLPDKVRNAISAETT